MTAFEVLTLQADLDFRLLVAVLLENGAAVITLEAAEVTGEDETATATTDEVATDETAAAAEVTTAAEETAVDEASTEATPVPDPAIPLAAAVAEAGRVWDIEMAPEYSVGPGTTYVDRD
jgi:hypothetical protein